MDSYIDVKFVNLISPQLQQFKKKSDFLWNFRCPYCGDSQKSSTKARGFVYQKKNDLFYKCHNCGIGQSLGNLIKFLDPNMHKEYVLEKYKSGRLKEEPEFDFTPSKTLASTTHYDKTLRAWLNRFLQNKEKAKFLYNKEFVRMWEFYLASCSAAFKFRDLVVYQLQLVKNFTAPPSNRRNYIYQ